MIASRHISGIRESFCIRRKLLPACVAPSFRVAAIFFLAVFCLTSAVHTKDRVTESYTLQIEVLGEGSTRKDPNVLLVAEGGWPLSIELSTDDALGIVTFNGSGIEAFPDLPQRLVDITSITNEAVGFLLFSNPDGVSPAGDPDPSYCLSFPSFYFLPGDFKSIAGSILTGINHSGCPSILPPDEEYLYFAVGSDPVAFTKKTNGSIDWERESLVEGSADPPFPPTGTSPRIPGLVILSDSGIGDFYNGPIPIYSPLSANYSYLLALPRKARNLAAYINSVGYLLRNGKDTQDTVIVASWMAPKNIISPYVERDGNVGEGTCEPHDDVGTSETKLRINGSAELVDAWLESPGSPLDSVLLDLLEVKLRIFVVNGKAPQNLPDLNRDNIVDSADAIEAGYTLLSEEKTVSLRIALHNFFGTPVDLDANGCTGPAVSPAGAGGLGRIPE